MDPQYPYPYPYGIPQQQARAPAPVQYEPQHQMPTQQAPLRPFNEPQTQPAYSDPRDSEPRYNGAPLARQPEPEDAPYELSQDPNRPLTMRMNVPDNAAPGTKIQCTAPDGQELRLTIPDGLPPGSMMTLTQDPDTQQWKCVAEPAEEPSQPERAPAPAPSRSAPQERVTQERRTPQPSLGGQGRVIPRSEMIKSSESPPPRLVQHTSPQVRQYMPPVQQYQPQYQAPTQPIYGQPLPVNLSYVPPPVVQQAPMVQDQIIGTRASDPMAPPVTLSMDPALFNPARQVPYYQSPEQVILPQRPSYTPPVIVPEQRPSYTPLPVIGYHPQMGPPVVDAGYTMPAPQTLSYVPPPVMQTQPQSLSYVPPPVMQSQPQIIQHQPQMVQAQPMQTASYVPPPVQQTASYVPPPVNMHQGLSPYTQPMLTSELQPQLQQPQPINSIGMPGMPPIQMFTLPGLGPQPPQPQPQPMMPQPIGFAQPQFDPLMGTQQALPSQMMPAQYAMPQQQPYQGQPLAPYQGQLQQTTYQPAQYAVPQGVGPPYN